MSAGDLILARSIKDTGRLNWRCLSEYAALVLSVPAIIGLVWLVLVITP